MGTGRSPGAVDGETRIGLRVIAFLDEDVFEERSVAFCPFRSSTTHVPDCLACDKFAHLESGAVVCARRPPLSSSEASALVAGRHICSGAESLAGRTPVGAVAENVVVCATAKTRIAIAEAVVRARGAHGVVVVDRALRPIAFIASTRLVSKVESRTLTLAECHDEAFSTFDESLPLADALGHLIHDRRRAAVTVDADGRVTGLVWDLHVLHWLARAAQGHMSNE